MTPGEYNTILARQDGLCALCLQVPTYRTLVVDHSHDTGAVRALLCGQCNTALGLLEARGSLNFAWLSRAAALVDPDTARYVEHLLGASR